MRMRKQVQRVLPMFIQSRMDPRDAAFYSILILAAFIAFALGTWGLFLWYPTQGNAEPLTLGYAAYWVVRLFMLESGEIAGNLPWQLEVARFLAPAVMLTTVIKLTSEFAKEFWQEWRADRKDHVLLVGDHELMPLLVKGYGQSHKVVTLRWGQSGVQNLELKPWRFRSWGHGALQDASQELGVRALRRAHLTTAKHVVILHREAQTTLAILDDVLRVLRDNTDANASLHVHFDDVSALVVARQRIDDAQLGNMAYLTNLYEVAARDLVMRFPPEQNRSLQEPVRVAVVGAGALGRALCVQMGFSGHYPCLQNTEVLLLDTDEYRLSEGERALALSYPQLRECLDFQVETSHPLQYFADLDASGWKGLAQVWICLEDEVEGTALVDALQLLARKCLQGQAGEPQILNRMALVQELLADPDVLLRDKQSIDPMAEATHENYRNKYQPEGAVGEPWPRLARTYREANRRSAEHLWVKLRAVGWTQPFPQLPSRIQAEALIQGHEELLSRMEKRRWNADRYLNGWVYGPVRDNARKVHNLLVPWEELDALQQSKDTSNVMLIAELVEG